MGADFLEEVHGRLGCISCHGGQNLPDKEEAHLGMVLQPSAHGTCGHCHSSIAKSYETALHYTTAGKAQGLLELSYPHTFNTHAILEDIYQEKCASCHSSCGECHVSRPRAMGGGLHTEHTFMRLPPMEDTCWGCHGARNAGEYMGDVDGIITTPDVHYQAGMHCADCHAVENFHGSATIERSMWDLPSSPSCYSCHPNVYSEQDPIQAHRVHEQTSMSCYVCHSLPVNNCSGCHVHPDGSITVQRSMGFRIGLNPTPTEKYPYTYITLRHTPATKTMFDVYEKDLLPNYNQVPSLKMSTSHTIQRITPQNEDCSNCHGNATLFLQQENLPRNGSPANEALVVKEIP